MPSPPEALRKAAVLLATLDREAADALLIQMSPAEAERVRRAALELGPFDTAEQDAVLAEFVALAPSPRRRSGGVEWAGSALDGQPTAATGERPPFAFLRSAEAELLVSLLEAEHPQTVALVLAHLPPDRAAPVVTALPERARSEVLRRLAESDDAHPEMLREVETALAARFQELDRQRRRRLRGQRTLAEILAAARKTAATETGDEPGSRPAPASRLPWRMGDLASLDDAPLAEVLGACDEDLLALALASVDPGTYARLTRVLRPHEIRWTDERLAGLGPLPLADLELAAAGLLATAARLERQGRIRRTTSTRPATAAA